MNFQLQQKDRYLLTSRITQAHQATQHIPVFYVNVATDEPATRMARSLSRWHQREGTTERSVHVVPLVQYWSRRQASRTQSDAPTAALDAL